MNPSEDIVNNFIKTIPYLAEQELRRLYNEIEKHLNEVYDLPETTSKGNKDIPPEKNNRVRSFSPKDFLGEW